MSSGRQFPQMTDIMKVALTREACRIAVNAPHVGFDDNVLTDDDLPRLRDATEFNKPLHVQRFNQLIFAYRTGFRPEMMRNLKVGSFKTEVDVNGRKVLTVILGSMKQLVQDMSKSDLALFKCPIMQGDNPMFCAVAAVERQLQLLKNVGGVDNENPDPDAPLFRSVRTYSESLLHAPPSKEAFRGVADWVSLVLGKKRQFRDLSRRAAMTRLANTPGFSLVEVSKYFGVAENTAGRYHKQKRTMPLKAAAVLSGVKNNEPLMKEEGEAMAPPGMPATCSFPVQYVYPLKSASDRIFIFRPLRIKRKRGRSQRRKSKRVKYAILFMNYSNYHFHTGRNQCHQLVPG